jgi:hypothetical protein
VDKIKEGMKVSPHAVNSPASPPGQKPQGS